MSKIISVADALGILKDHIKFIRSASNGEQIFRCPFCGDSDNPNKGHLYVNNTMGMFNCYKCDIGGSINRMLDLFVGSKYKIPKIDFNYVRKGFSNATLENGSNAFEKYLAIAQKKKHMQIWFNFMQAKEDQPSYIIKDQYMMSRLINDDKLIPFLNETVMRQHLFSYYSEYHMNRFKENGFLGNNQKVIKYVDDYIINRLTSIMFLGYHKTLSLFKTDSKDIKYFKLKKNIFYGPNIGWDFFMIINQNKFKSNLLDIWKRKELDVYFAEGVFDALNLYLYNPSYVTGVKPDIILATGSKVSYASALYFVRDNFLKPINSHLFLDPEIKSKEFFKKYKRLKRVYQNVSVYQNGKYDYGDVSKDDLKSIKLCL